MSTLLNMKADRNKGIMAILASVSIFGRFCTNLFETTGRWNCWFLEFILSVDAVDKIRLDDTWKRGLFMIFDDKHIEWKF